jgi:hypothetical protein
MVNVRKENGVAYDGFDVNNNRISKIGVSPTLAGQFTVHQYTMVMNHDTSARLMWEASTVTIAVLQIDRGEEYQRRLVTTT